MIRVMLIEDDQTMRSLLRTLLEIEHFSVVTCDINTLDEIFEFVRQENPDAILLDVHLRNINGMDLLKRIRLDDQFKSLKIVMASGENLREQCIKLGANGFLLKPYMPDELIKILQS